MLDAALRVFAERGYTRTTMDDIAGFAGVTKPLVYAYFGSKEELFHRCVEHSGEALMEAMEKAGAEEPDPERKMWQRTLAYFNFVDLHRDEWRMMSAEGIPGDPVSYARVLVVQQMERFLEQELGSESPELEPFARTLVAVGEALADWWMDHPQESAEAMAVREMNFIWLGLRALRGGERWLPSFTAP